MSDSCGAIHTTGYGPGDPEDTGVHMCVDIADHSVGAHLCKCGMMWREQTRH